MFECNKLFYIIWNLAYQYSYTTNYHPTQGKLFLLSCIFSKHHFIRFSILCHCYICIFIVWKILILISIFSLKSSHDRFFTLMIMLWLYYEQFSILNIHYYVIMYDTCFNFFQENKGHFNKLDFLVPWKKGRNWRIFICIL